MPRARKRTTLPAQIDRVVKRIVQRFAPQSVILFGSQARDDPGPDSDVDLLVVMHFEGPKLDTIVELRGALRDCTISVDILVTTPEDFAWRKDIVGTIEWPASREGKVLYARA